MKTPRRFSHVSISRRRFVGQLSLGAAALTLGVRGQPPRSDAGSRKLGVALIGLGGYATGQLGPALKLTQHCRLAGVVTGHREKGLRWAREYGFPENHVYSYDTMHEMADNPDIDLAYVVTPNAIHAENCLAVAKAGKHLICEKPFTVSVAEAEAVLAACRGAGVKHSIGYRLHFDPYHKEMMRRAGAREFGTPVQTRGDRGFFLSAGRWRGERKLAGGGPMMDLGIYIIQAACMVAGGPSADAQGTPLPGRLVLPVAVTAKEAPKTRPQQFHDVEEAMHFRLEFANGDVCDAFTSYTHSADTFRAEGPKGWLNFKAHAFDYRGMMVDSSTGPLEYDQPAHRQQALQMDDFAQCVRDGRESRVAGEMGLRDMKILAAVYEAARTGRRVTLKA